jgi:tetratricopeptide (TPR) repeat protein
MEAGQWAAAEDDYGRALQILPDAAVALGIVRARLARKDLEAAVAGLRTSADLVGADDVTAQRRYLELRRAAVLLALGKDEVSVADALLDAVPAGVGPEQQLGLAMEVALQFRKQGKPDLALERMQALVDAANEGRLAVSPERRTELRQRVAALYAARASVRLSTGKIDGAAKDVARALELRPDDRALQLQRVLVLAGKAEHALAQAELDKLDGVQGHAEVAAILASLQVETLVGRGELDRANELLARARRLAGELPEVHVAIAHVLTATPPDDLSKADRRVLARKGLISYPRGQVTRVGEALSELDWAHQQIRGLGPDYPYRGPDTVGRIQALRDEIRGFYRYEVSFQGDPSTVLELENPHQTAAVVQLRAGDFSADATVQPGATDTVTIPDPGPLHIQWRGTDAVLLAEPYTRVELTL